MYFRIPSRQDSKMISQTLSLIFLAGTWLNSFGVQARSTVAPATTAVGPPNRECDYNSNTKITSPGYVTSLKTCTLLCEKSSECRSLTFYSGSKWCTHFSTACSTTRAVKGATAVILQPRVSVFSLAAEYGKQCDFGHGEVFLAGSSGLAASVSACLASCEAVAACKSVVFYDKYNYCSHVSTGCTKTTAAVGAVSFIKSATTTS